MGQYFLIVNTTKREFLDPHQFGDGLKLGELNGGQVMHALVAMLSSGAEMDGGAVYGRWAGDRIVIAGDYAQDGEHVPEDMMKEILDGRHKSLTLYGLCSKDVEETDEGELITEAMIEDISMDVIKELCERSEWVCTQFAESEFFWMIHEGRAKDRGEELPEFLKKLKQDYVVSKLAKS